MPYDPNKHHRRSIRLQGYDYTQAGAYFVTICAFQRECVFGAVIDGVMVLNDEGAVVQLCWDDLPNHYSHVQLDAFTVMPNHVHGIIVLTATSSHPLPEIVRAFKSFAAQEANQLRGVTGIPVWQRGYYEHIIRHEDELRAIRKYILYNPLKWAEDMDNPAVFAQQTSQNQ
jgi:putative transposase